MKILIDMNLSPEWVQEFKNHDIQAIHWTSVGEFNAHDKLLIKWARKNNHIIFTHDLDFRMILALTKARKPSVIQVRTQDITVKHLSKMVRSALKNHQAILEEGALIVLDENKKRIRILPL